MQITIQADTLNNFHPKGLPQAATGACTTTSGSDVVTGTFRNQWIGKSGFRINLGGTDYTVDHVVDAGTLILTAPYTGTSGTATAFLLYPYVLLRIYALQSFIAASDLEPIQPGSPGSSDFYVEMACSVLDGTLYLPQLELESTTDAVNPGERAASWSAWFYRPDGGQIQPYYKFEQFRLPSVPPTTTWAQIAGYNNAGVPPPPNYDTYTKDQINAIFAEMAAAAGSAGGVTGDIQVNQGGLFGASFMNQGNATGIPDSGFDTHSVVTVTSPLTQNIAGHQSARGLRIMDTDDGAGNAQWFEMIGTYGAFNFQWQNSGVGTASSREFFIDNGRTRIVMHGFWRGNVDEGDSIGIFAKDPSPHDSINWRFMNGILISGEWQPMSGQPPGFYVKAHNSDNSYGYGYGYQFYFDHDGLNLPKDPTNTLHAATKQYVDARIAGSPGVNSPGGVNLDLQYNNSGIFGGSSIKQTDNHTISLWTPLTGPGPGTADGARLRIYDTNDGAGNASWLEIGGTLGSMNFKWLYSGTGQADREFLWDNGKSHMVMSGHYRNGTDEGDYISMFTWDTGAPGGVFNATMLVGEHPAIAPNPSAPGFWICAHNTTYQYHFDHDGLNLPNDPVLPLHAATKQYVDSHAGGGGSPAGTGTELQYRASSSAFGALPNSSLGVDRLGTTQQLNLGGVLRMRSTTGPRSALELDVTGNVATFTITDPTDTLDPCSVFYAIHSSSTRGYLYFGRQNGSISKCPTYMMFYTGPTGVEDTRRLFISPDGSVHVNEQTLVTTSSYALTASSGLGGGFAKAFFCNGPSDFASLPRLWDGSAYQQIQIGAAGTGPGGSGRMLYLP